MKKKYEENLALTSLYIFPIFFKSYFSLWEKENFKVYFIEYEEEVERFFKFFLWKRKEKNLHNSSLDIENLNLHSSKLRSSSNRMDRRDNRQ